MKDLVKELRDLAKETDMESPTCELWEVLAGKDTIGCFDGRYCVECRALALNALADRIEAEYDPKPEPDTVEKVAKDMVAWMDNLIEAFNNSVVWYTDGAADPFRKRLEALGVKVDG